MSRLECARETIRLLLEEIEAEGLFVGGGVKTV
jgi:hypothetical protein